jgi:voltage-gated potassium channel
MRTERWRLLRTIDRLLARPLDVLAVVWLVLLVVELAWGGDARLERLILAIWGIFIADFVLDMVIAPDRLGYIRRNWLTLLSLLLPALRVFRALRALRVLRAARSIRSIGVLRVLTSLNRGMAALARTFGRRNLGFVVALTIAVIMVGAAGMAFLESPEALRETGQPGPGLPSYGEALWWTAMLLTTIGSQYWPVTLEGRVLAWLLSVYGVAIFGYITAAIASHFIDSDRAALDRRDVPVVALVAEVAALRARIDELAEVRDRPSPR